MFRIDKASDAGSTPRCDIGFFFQSQLSVQTSLRCSLVQPPPCAVDASTFVRVLKIPNTGSSTPLLSVLQNAARSGRNGYTNVALQAAVP